MATPVSRDIGKCLETVWDTVIDFLLVRVGFVVGLANTFGDDLGVTFFMAGVFAVRTLHAGSVFEEVSAKSTTHDVVELLCDEFVTLLLVDLFLLLTNGTLAIETDVERSPILQLFGWVKVSVRLIKN